MTARRALVLGVSCVALACDRSRPTSERPAADIATKDRLTIDTIASGLEVPWALTFAPDGRVFVTERVGRIRVIENGVLRRDTWASLPVASRGEAGLMGIAVAPDFATSKHVFVVATFDDGGVLVNRVLRFTDDSGRGVNPTVVLDGIPAAKYHAGDAIAFGPDGMLYVATGDARDPDSAQDERSLAGKILRLRPDGSVPTDNPTQGSLIYARGVRNAQGLAWDPATRQAFATDHGPSGFPNEYFRRDGDELNVISPGANLGWPTVAALTSSSRYTSPLVEWSGPGIAPAGIAMYAGPHAPWAGSLFVAALKGEQLRRIVVRRDVESSTSWRALGDEPLFVRAFGRLRAVAMGPDGMIYFTTSNRDGRGAPRPGDDHVFRLRVNP
jgi:glucose/arabinose dehydrogenase